MSIETNLRGRIRNTLLPQSNGMLPVYEAVSNAIHAIEDAKIPLKQGSITLHINRDGQTTFQFYNDNGLSNSDTKSDTKGDIIGFTIIDNGIGFTEDNMNSFLTLDSEYKVVRGGRGVGRLLWLKAFESAEVESVYEDKEGSKKRSFTFDIHNGVSRHKTEEAMGESRHTKVCLSGLSQKYRSAMPKTASVLANLLFEHCLWYFVRQGGAPSIKVIDNDESIDLNDVFEKNMIASANNESIDVKGVKFDIVHIKISASSGRSHNIVYCASNRLVTQDNLKNKIPGLFGNLSEGKKTFIYECYVSSQILDERVRSERTSFDIDEEPTELFREKEISQKEIREAVIGRATAFLSPYLDEKRYQSEERLMKFVSQKAPRYRPILERIPKEKLVVDPDISDKDLDLLLHKEFSTIESKLIAEGHDIMIPKEGESYKDYKSRLNEYLKVADDIKKSDLANYVAHRRIVLDLLEKAIQRKADGKYEREELIHDLIMPMGCTSNDIHFDSCNLWLIDERMAFHDFMASDMKLSAMPITSSDETKEPDILALNVYDKPILVTDSQKLPLASIIVVELKRPMRNDAGAGEDKDPIEQALGYVERIRDGKVMTKTGRPIPKSEDTPGFCYVICDITPSVEKRCKLLGLRPTQDYTGYFGFNPNYRAYIEVISFDRLVNSAKERNKAFFDKLGLPTT